MRVDKALAAVLAILVSSCGGHADDAAHAMGFEVEPSLRLPVAYTSVSDDGAEITITTSMAMPGMEHDYADCFEALQSGAVYRAWAKTDAGWIDLGEFQPGVDLKADAQSATQIQVTIESEGTAAAPSADVVVSGDAGKTLTFSGLGAADFVGAEIEATMDDTSVTLTYHGLPALPAGFELALWSVPTDADGEEEGDPVLVGVLPDPEEGALTADGQTWPDHFLLAITIEAKRGASGKSTVTAFLTSHGDTDSGTAHGH